MSHLDEGQLHALLDGELEGGERIRAEAHLATCAECRAAYDEARTIFQEADALIATVDLPPASAAPTAAPAPIRSERRFRWQQVAWAATVVLAVGLGWLAKSDQLRREGAKENLTAAPVVAAAPAPAPSPATGAAAPAEEPARAKLSDEKPSGAARSRTETAPAPSDQAMDKIARERDAPAQAAAPAAEPAPANETGALTQTSADTLRRKALTGAAAPMAQPPEAAALEARRPAPLPNATSVRKDEAARSISGPLGARAAPTPLRTVKMEEAVRILGGSIRLVDGMTPTRILAGEASLVRVVYDDPPGRELWLDQRRPVEAEGDAVVSNEAVAALLPGDTVAVVMNRGAHGLRWLDQTGFRLGLTGFLPTDSLRALARRVR